MIGLLRAIAGQMSSPVGADVLQTLMVEARHDPELMAELRRELSEGEPGIVLMMLARAVARGEARPESVVPRLASVPIALLRNEFLLRGGSPVTDETIAQIVDLVFLPLVRGGP